VNYRQELAANSQSLVQKPSVDSMLMQDTDRQRFKKVKKDQQLIENRRCKQKTRSNL
jgi:hypothetical protein